MHKGNDCYGKDSCNTPKDVQLISQNIQGVSRLVDITVRGDFLGLCDQKIHINMCPILDGNGVMGIF
jgi:hypothetical protein